MSLENDNWDKVRPMHGGIQLLKFYENGYGVSVVKHSGSYGSGRGLWEMAVLKGNKDNWELTYETPVTDDVLGYLSEAEVRSLRHEVSQL